MDVQFDLFSSRAGNEAQLRKELATARRASESYLCWTKMQAESGQNLDQIFARKEMERLAGEGVFFWGVGNPIDFTTAKAIDSIDIVFSKMLSSPKSEDSNPDGIFVWRKYIDGVGKERDLPSHVLLLSRANTKMGPKKRHYALVCYSDKKLVIGDEGPFDPSAYRNAGVNGGKVGFSQVTSLLTKTAAQQESTKYRINFKARLLPPFLVRLTDPALLEYEDKQLVDDMTIECTADWIELASQIRRKAHTPHQFIEGVFLP